MPVSVVRKLRGHCAYYGITGNSRKLWIFRNAMLRIWRKWLSRRSQRSRLSWEKFSRLLVRYPIPAAVAVHSRLRVVANP